MDTKSEAGKELARVEVEHQHPVVLRRGARGGLEVAYGEDVRGDLGKDAAMRRFGDALLHALECSGAFEAPRAPRPRRAAPSLLVALALAAGASAGCGKDVTCTAGFLPPCETSNPDYCAPGAMAAPSGAPCPNLSGGPPPDAAPLVQDTARGGPAADADASGGGDAADGAPAPDGASGADAGPPEATPPDGGRGPDLGCAGPVRVACGLCGTQARACDGTLGACVGQGPCVPGNQQVSPDGCEARTCGNDCQWRPWALGMGAQCVSGSKQGCNAGINCPHQGTQTCVGCLWAACSC